jgi:hypothetical protein
MAVILNHEYVCCGVCVSATGCTVPIGARITNALSKFQRKCSLPPLGQPADATHAPVPDWTGTVPLNAVEAKT